MSPTALQSVQVGSQLAYVIPLWNNVQAQIFGQVMFGVQADGRPTAQVSGGGQLQLKLGKGFSLFLQGGIGATQGSGPRQRSQLHRRCLGAGRGHLYVAVIGRPRWAPRGLSRLA